MNDKRILARLFGMAKLDSLSRGLSLLEILIGAALSMILIAAALGFYVSQHNQWLAQGEISNMQQNLRVATDEIITRIRVAGANLPAGFSPIIGSNTSPDTITIRYADYGCELDVGDHTQNAQAVPIHVPRYSDLSCFAVGQIVYINRPSDGSGQWFTITGLADNQGTGWKEVSHLGTTLNQDPMPGDQIVKLSQAKYYLDFSDAQHPKLMRALNSDPAAVYAEDIEDMEFVYTLASGLTTTSPAASDSIKSVNLYLKATTANKDVKFSANSGFRKRDLSVNVALRNL